LLAAFDSKPPRRLLELGAGDGTFFLEVARRLAPRWRHVQVMLVDRQTLVRPETLEQFTARGWSAIAVTDDVFQWLDTSAEEFDAVLANLFLHHFSRAHLNILLRGIAERTGVFVAVEPRRAAFPLAMSRPQLLGNCDLSRRGRSVRVGCRE
jgi:ubiquinone/menaquinone biosynthesis C-methylase UbiE